LCAAKNVNILFHLLTCYMQRDEGAFGVVYEEAGSSREATQQHFELMHRSDVRSCHDKSIIGVLENDTWSVRS
jgi:hypothetical protein